MIQTRHLDEVAAATADGAQEVEQDVEEDLHHLCLKENHVINMEVDTGSAVSCISRITYKNKFRHLKLEYSDHVLNFYNGVKIKHVGVIKPIF